MIECLRAFLDFAYLARRSSHDTESLDFMGVLLADFDELRQIFIEVGVRDNVSLPRQHALLHYRLGIQRFGALNGLCTSITESKHIVAVKRPWRASNRHNAVLQVLKTNTVLSKLSALRSYLSSQGLLHGSIIDYAMRKVS